MSGAALRTAALCAVVAITVGGCEPTRAPALGDLSDITPGMTDRDVAELLGPPTTTSVSRSFSRDSVLWTLVDSDPVPRHVWSLEMSDAELSRTVAPGDTSVHRTDRWTIPREGFQGPPARAWVVDYGQQDGEWRVQVTTDKSDGLQY